MIYINWNIKCYCNIEKIITFLKERADACECIIALEEVMPDRAEMIRDSMSEQYYISYSLDYRKPDEEFDTDNRRLGVMILVSKDYKVLESGVFERSLFPDRTLWVSIEKDNKVIKIVALHSITGVAFKIGKAVQFRSFAECIRDYKPDIISMDANEPRIDHYDIDEMEFFDQGDDGKSARLFFKQIKKQGLYDAYISQYDKRKYVYGEPIITSHKVQGKTNRRYDFVFISEQFAVQQANYWYDEALRASSDHAMIEVVVK